MSKKRISLTLENDLVRRVDRKVDNNEFSNRSQAIESMIKEYLDHQKIKKAFILAGGDYEGDTPDSMINLNGKPLLEHTLSHLSTQGIEEVIIALGDRHEKIREHFGEAWKGIDITYLIEEEPLGTAGCLLKARKMLEDTFLMINGDILCKIDIKDMSARHRMNKALATISLTTIDDISPYGVVKMKGEKIVGFIEKPSKEKAPSNLINAGVYILEPEVMELIPSETPTQIESLFENLAGKEKLFGYVYEGEWRDIGT